MRRNVLVPWQFCHLFHKMMKRLKNRTENHFSPQVCAITDKVSIWWLPTDCQSTHMRCQREMNAWNCMNRLTTKVLFTNHLHMAKLLVNTFVSCKWTLCSYSQDASVKWKFCHVNNTAWQLLTSRLPDIYSPLPKVFSF